MNSSKRASKALSALQPALLAPTTPVLSPSECKVPTELQVQAAAQKVFDLKRKASSSGTTADNANSKDTAVPSPTTSVSSNAAGKEAGVARLAGDLRSSFSEIQTVRREVGALKQIYLDFKNETSTIIGSLRTQTEQVKELANSQVPGSRAFIDSGKAKLDSKSQDLLTKIEELQDNIDDLKNDVTSRRIKPKAKQMDAIKASMQSRAAELEELTQYISSVKPMWKKTWEAELQNIVEEQQLLNHQEELLSDLKADHENVVTIFEQIQQYVSLRMASSGRKQEFRPPSPTRGHEGLKTVLLEVKGLAPASDQRMKAIEQAEKIRRKEVDEKTDEFASELSGFVEGKLLKKTGMCLFS